MEKINLICIDDQPEVLAAVRRDLDPFTEKCIVSECESAEEAQALLNEFYAEGRPVGLLICDHVMPGKTGVDFLSELVHRGQFPHTQKILLTGLATHADTIQAINQAAIDWYIEKPWKKEMLVHAVRVLLAKFVFASGMDYQDYLDVIDQETLYEGLRHRT